MQTITLKREKYTATYTMGRLQVGNRTLYTVEQEWRPTAPGGEPSNSCVPAGVYALEKYVRPSGKTVLILQNHGLGVYKFGDDRPNDVGRYLILMHSGNTSQDVVGCIAPGLSRDLDAGFVGSSRDAMKIIMEYEPEELVIHGRNDYEVAP